MSDLYLFSNARFMMGCVCRYCGYENNELNPFSKCMMCGQPLEMRFSGPA